MSFKQFNESEDKLADTVKSIIKELQKKGGIVPNHVAKKIRRDVENKKDKASIIARYIRSLGGSFESQL